jgi:hypothetical protein
MTLTRTCGSKSGAVQTPVHEADRNQVPLVLLPDGGGQVPHPPAGLCQPSISGVGLLDVVREGASGLPFHPASNEASARLGEAQVGQYPGGGGFRPTVGALSTIPLASKM